MVKKLKRNKKKAPKEIALTAKQLKAEKLGAHCMKCKDTVTDIDDPKVFIHVRKSEAGKKTYSFRLGGVHNDCGTGLSRMLSQEVGLKLAKGK